MKTKLLYFVLLSTLTINAQTQIGETLYEESTGDEFGISVSLSTDGNVIAIGGSYNDGNGDASGHVRVYENISGVWTKIGNDIFGIDDGDYFGISISLSRDKSKVIVGSSDGYVQVYNLSTLLSVEDNIISKSVTVFPNPVKNIFQINLSNTLELEKATIYNYIGQNLLESKETVIDISNLSKGIYFLEIETINGIGVKRIIKN